MRRNATRDSATLPAGSLHLHCTDTNGEWLVSLDDGFELVREHDVKELAENYMLRFRKPSG